MTRLPHLAPTGVHTPPPVHSPNVTQLSFDNALFDAGWCQRTTRRVQSWRHISEGGFNQRRYSVLTISEEVARAFVLLHHYSRSIGSLLNLRVDAAHAEDGHAWLAGVLGAARARGRRCPASGSGRVGRSSGA
ncbi:hypothetical protein L3i22_060840 [Actinoplanes sp. L3-i22]|nr:hypothetical protein L3i22_060840 [Actinoplanes sp. L3-i22]